MSYPDHLVRLVEDYLSGIDYGEEKSVAPLAAAMNYSLLAGGKRIRPVLLMASGVAYGADPKALLPTAAAVEMIHTYSLIHDDLPAFDDDDLRRGKPTCHIQYGESVAILAGDALFAEAFRLICEKQDADPAVLREVIGEIATATGVQGMVGGQYLDVAGVDSEKLETVHLLKTGRLIMACVQCGALLAGAPKEELLHLRRFASQLGLLFQIKDDILDVVGETSTLGKPAGSDQRLERRTYVSVYGLEEAERLALEARNGALEALKAAAGDGCQLVNITAYIHERQR